MAVALTVDAGPGWIVTLEGIVIGDSELLGAG